MTRGAKRLAKFRSYVEEALLRRAFAWYRGNCPEPAPPAQRRASRLAEERFFDWQVTRGYCTAAEAEA